MNRRALLVLIPVLVLLGNAVAYVAISKRRTGEAPPSTPVVVSAPVVPAPPPAPLPAAPAEPAPHEEAEQSAEAAALARRAAGLVALEAGDYDKALIQFTEAQALVGDKARVADLIRVTQDLRSKPAKPPAAPRARAFASRAVRASARRSEPREESASAAPEAESAAAASGGTLIVTTTPRGLLVQVDDASIDLTPMRTRLKTGPHKVALLDGTRRVYETSIDLKEGATATLLKDVSSELAAEPKGGAVAAVAPPHEAASPPRPSPAQPDAERAPNAQTASPAAVSPAAPRATATPSPSLAGSGRGTGGLDISSPGLYGVVWINGRPRGYPPLKVQDVPAGPAKVEIRVNGVQKRASSVVVKAGGTQIVELVARP